MNDLTALLLMIALEVDTSRMRSVWCASASGKVYIRINEHTKTLTLATIESYQRGTATAVVDMMMQIAAERGWRFVIENALNPIVVRMAHRRGMSEVRYHPTSYETFSHVW